MALKDPCLNFTFLYNKLITYALLLEGQSAAEAISYWNWQSIRYHSAWSYTKVVDRRYNECLECTK